MINWYCKNYSITKTDCGPWNEKHETFSIIKHTHRNCNEFKIGEPKLRGKENWNCTEIEKEMTKVFSENKHQLLHELIVSLKGSEKVCLIKDKRRWMNQ